MFSLVRSFRRAVDVTPFLRLPKGVKQVGRRSIALAMHLSGLNRLMHRYQVATKSPFIRAVNYHDVPPSMANAFERQLLFFRKRFVPVGYGGLIDFHGGHWPHDKPGIVVCFDDGLKSQAEVAAPLLEKHGFVGWFLIPLAFIDAPREKQGEYAADHRIAWSRAPGDDLGAMSWEDIRRLDQRHVVGCHTYSHVRLSADLSAEELDHEIKAAKHCLEQRLGHVLSVFCWVGGEEWSYSASAARTIREAGYQVCFLNTNGVIRPRTDLLQLHRTNTEAYHPLWFVRHSLSGFLDLIYGPQRDRILRVLEEAGGSEAA